MKHMLLDGIKIIDLSRLVAGNLTSMLLADFGATVIKIEQPGVGDPLRKWTYEDKSYWWSVYGRNKYSITLNLKHTVGQDMFYQLIAKADCLLESSAPGTLNKWDITWEKLQARNPSLILTHISGWGQSGTDYKKPGFGTLVEASSGFAYMNGLPDSPPVLPPFPMADMYAGLYAFGSTMTALYARDCNNGIGQEIDVSLFESLFSVLGPQAAEYAASNRIRGRHGSRSQNAAPRGVYQTSDGAWLALSASTNPTAQRFFKAYQLEYLLEDERFSTNKKRVENAKELDKIIINRIKELSLEQHLNLIGEYGLTLTQVQTIAEIENNSHWQERDLLLNVEDNGSKTRMHNVVPKFSQTPGQICWAGRDLGEDNELIYQSELGLSVEEISDLENKGVI